MKKAKHLYISAILVFVIWAVFLILAYRSRTKLTYLEYEYENETVGRYIEINDTQNYIEQTFTSPYDILHGIAVKIGTFGRDNNSVWDISIAEGDTGKVLFHKEYNASQVVDTSYHLFKFKKNIKVIKGKDYILRITPVFVNENTAITFYVGNNERKQNVSYNGILQDEVLCFSIYGGNTDNWWIFYYLIPAVFLTLTIVRGNVVILKGNKLQNDRLFGGMITAIIVFFLLRPFAIGGFLIDECDNIGGGTIIANGGVLYRDYVTQHTPFMYYLCSVFSLSGAGSVEQFRLSYYFLVSVVWGLLYIRHSNVFGRKKMIILAAIECIIVALVINNYVGYMIMADCMQGLCTVALALEFLGYYKDKKIDWKRAIIISAAVWCNIGSAFLGVYTVAIVFLFFLGVEIKYFLKEKKTFKFFGRYIRLLTCLIIPPAVTVLYFWFNNSLLTAYRQAYVFNREVYPNYTPVGNTIIDPYLKAGKSIFTLYAEGITNIFSAKATIESILQIGLMTIVIMTLATMIMKKKYIESFFCFLVMISCASRGTWGYHAIAGWYTAGLIIALYGKNLILLYNKKSLVPIAAIIGMFLISRFGTTAFTSLLTVQKPVSELESRIISLTDEGEKILIDVYSCDATYLLYKNRYPANRAWYMLAWYMDWYEQDTIDDLIEAKPGIVVYNPDITVWSNQYYTNAFYKELKKNYTQISDIPEDDWKYLIWRKNTE